MIQIDSNWSRIDRELTRLQHLPGEDVARLDIALELAKEEIKSTVHVLSGALKESTAAHTKKAPHIWEGEVTVGEGLGYAEFERRRKGVKPESGTPHDFIEPNKELIHAQFLKAVHEVIKG